MKFDVDDKNRCRLVCVCKISFKSVQVCGGCCKMFRGLTFVGTQCKYIFSNEILACGSNFVKQHLETVMV